MAIEHKMQAKKLWTEDEEHTLLRLSLTGFTRLQMQHKLGRSMQTIFSKI